MEPKEHQFTNEVKYPVQPITSSSLRGTWTAKPLLTLAENISIVRRRMSHLLTRARLSTRSVWLLLYGVGRLCGNIQGGIGVGRTEATGTAGSVWSCEKGKEAKASSGSGGLACLRPTAHPWGERQSAC